MKRAFSYSAFMLLSLLSAAQKKIAIPYFGYLTNQELCGGKSLYCQPPTSRYWAKVENVDFEDESIYFLGQQFSEFHDRLPCDSMPMEKDIQVINKTSINGKLSQDRKTDFDLKIAANLSDLLKKQGNNIDSLKVGFQTELKHAVEKATESTVELEYRVIQLRVPFIQKLAAIAKKLPDGQNISTGISVVTVKGTWTSSLLKSTLLSIEATAEYKSLSADAKVEYENVKKRILDGTYEPLSIVLDVAYINNEYGK